MTAHTHTHTRTQTHIKNRFLGTTTLLTKGERLLCTECHKKGAQVNTHKRPY